MAEQPTQEAIDKWHRWFAVECNNQGWDLMAKPERTPDEDRQMLYLAYSSAFHWGKVGVPLNNARAEMALAHVHAMLGHGELALSYAESCLGFLEANGGEDWDVAFAHAEMAHAAAAAGDADLHAKHYAKAQELGEAIKEEGDRNVFLEEFAKIPTKVSTA
jgi:hypothetical protein